MRTKCIAVLIAFCTLIALASAQIDNCCFVDRQCGSNQEWINGYHAYQNGQCAVPAPSGQPANSSAPVDKLLRHRPTMQYRRGVDGRLAGLSERAMSRARSSPAADIRPRQWAISPRM